MEKALQEIMMLHADAGASQGYTGTGYGVLDHTCAVCGTHGEYGEEWPCKTWELAAKGLGLV